MPHENGLLAKSNDLFDLLVIIQLAQLLLSEVPEGVSIEEVYSRGCRRIHLITRDNGGGESRAFYRAGSQMDLSYPSYLVADHRDRLSAALLEACD